MLQRTILRRGEQIMRGGTGRPAPIEAVGGIPSFGNIYSGKINPESFNAPPLSTGTPGVYKRKANSLYRELNSRRATMYDDPTVRAMIDKCPYFALCDMVVWQRISADFLDPGIVTDEEHQLLLLHSRAYFDKWRVIHSRPDQGNWGPRMYIQTGQSTKLEEIFDYIGVPKEVSAVLKRKPHLIDDASLIGMSGTAWVGANLEEKMRDDLTGMTLVDGGMAPEHVEEMLEVLDKMRTFVIVRNDIPNVEQAAIQRHEQLVAEGLAKPEDDITLPGHPDFHREVFQVKFSDCITCYDLYEKLGIQPYNGQLKIYNWFDPQEKIQRTVSIRDEDTYFDFLVNAFYNANVRLHVPKELSRMDLQHSYAHGSMSRTIITVTPESSAATAKGRWF